MREGGYLNGGADGKVLGLVEGGLVWRAVGLGNAHPLQELASQDPSIPALTAAGGHWKEVTPTSAVAQILSLCRPTSSRR